MIAIRVDNRIRIPLTALPEHVVTSLKKDCEHDNPDFAKKRAQGFATYNVPAIIRTWRMELGELTLPRGAMARVRSTLKRAGVAFKVIDARVEGAPLLRPIEYVGHEPRQYQRGAALAAIEKEQGIIRAATGSGKTTTALYLSSLIGLNTLIVLPTVKLMHQTQEVARELLDVSGDRLGIIHAGKKKLRPVTVATQQTLWSRSVDPEIREYFGAVMIDEAHHAAARTFAEVIDQFPCRFRIAFSADERRRDRKEFLVYDAFGAILHETSRSDCEDVGAVVDVEIRIVPTNFEADWYRDDPDFNKLLDAMSSNPERDKLALDAIAEELKMGELAIACTHRRDHVRVLDRGIIARGFRSGCMLGGNDATDVAEFEATRNGLREGSVQAGVGTYGALGEGIDLPAVAVGVAVTPIASNKQKFNQFRGRLCRPSQGKHQGRMYYLFDRRVFDERMLGNILAWNRTVKVKIGGQWVDARDHRRAIMAG